MSQNKGLSGAKSTLAAQQATTSLWGGNSTYVEDLYERYLAGEDLPADWRKYFASLPGAAGDTPHGPLIRELEQRAMAPRQAAGGST
jgi:2-oxoglutarate dehydrogenase E1 component